MKKQPFTLLCLLLFSLSVSAQDLTFESTPTGLPAGLFTNGNDHTFQLSTENPHSGKYALSVTAKDKATDNSVAIASYSVPAKFNGKTLTLKGWIRTANMTGKATIWLRVDGAGGAVAFDNMLTRAVTTNIGWTQFTVTVPYPSSEAKSVAFGGLVMGKGNVWFDDLEIAGGNETVSNPINVVEPSNVAEITLNPQTTQNLYALGRIWGLLKYFHPAVADGNYDWDAELFKELNKVSTNRGEFNAEMLHWINALGTLSDCKCKPAVTDSLLAANNWINNKDLFDPQVSTALKNVITGRNTGKNKYISFAPGVNNPNFSTEKPYPGMSSIDPGYRMLSLFRFWNMVEYFFPYKNIIGEDWDKALAAMIPSFVSAKTRLDYKLAVWSMINRIHDTHANLYSHTSDPEMLKYIGGTRQLPVTVRLVENKWMITKISAENPDNYPLKKGDVIVTINGKTAADRAAFLMPYSCASNISTANRNIGNDFFWTDAEKLHLQISRDGQNMDIDAPSMDIQAYMAMARKNATGGGYTPPYKLLNPQVGYVTFDKIKSGFFKQMFEEFKDTKGIVLDIRNYPSEFVVFSLNEYLRSAPAPFVKFTNTNTDKPGIYNYTPNVVVGTKNKDAYKGKLVVLVNEESQSQAEYTTMALRAGGRATVMGSQTAGADGNISPIVLPGGLSTFFSGIGVFYPDGKGTQRIGMVPDVEVKPTVKGIAQGKDEVLERAVEWIEKN
ncbi:peptidase S41 [Mucilaginibacter mali]|uniref:Peptidase S41 n=1 Tax=Mucilaginibacter mali TaxID=2740462 RepID=A0A7D4QAS9_9SPHI|nr:S41 family peptidase [Mucilaginibacter mali]QKJ32191.1 peptidase S41 [Mucilaginibacter mali]